MNLKQFIRRVVRKTIKTKENETIDDALDRYKTKVDKLFYREKYSYDDIESALKDIGINEGDTLFVHASWRKFFNFLGTPEDLISILETICGKDGTIVMPCYGKGKTFLDVKNSPSAAGVLSETFRKTDGVKRSQCTHFSVAAKGQYAQYLIEEHELSRYGFDVHSPCYRLTTIPKAKILFLGLGSEPTKISIVHCAGGVLYESDPKIKVLLSNHYKSVLIDEEGSKHEKEMIIRVPGHGNNEAMFKKVFRTLKNKKVTKISNLDIALIDAKETYDVALDYAKKGEYCYLNMNRL